MSQFSLEPERASVQAAVTSANTPSHTPAARSLLLACYGAAAIMVLVTAYYVISCATNVPFWDGFNVFLAYLNWVHDARDALQWLEITAGFSNEHCIFTIHLFAALFHTVAGELDFRVLTMLTSATLLPIAALMILPIQGSRDRALATLFAGVFLFNFQHYENLFWTTSAVGHFTVVLLALLSLWFLQRPGWINLFASVVCAALAVLTVLQGAVVFPIAIASLLLARRWREAALWITAAVALGLIWIWGEFSPTHKVAPFDLSLAGIGRLVRFWLGLLGAPLAVGQRWLAPWMGAGVLLVGLLLWRAGAWKRSPYHTRVLLFATGALALIAIGRVGVDPTQFLTSRYRILSCLILATLAWHLLDEGARRGLPAWVRGAIALVLLAIALEQTTSFAWRGPAIRDQRNIAARYYAEHGTLAGAPVRLFPDDARADAILAESARKGIFDFAAVGRGAPYVETIPRPALGP